MSDILNRLLRPFVRFFFDNIYPHIPGNDAALWFFSRHYFIEGWDEVKKNWDPLKEKLLAFTRAGYGILLNFCTEDATNLVEAAYTRDLYIEFIQSINALHLESSVRLSMKMSQFGCFSADSMTDEFGRGAVEHVIRYARQHGNMGVTLDGERLIHAEAVADFARTMNKKYGNVAIRFQAYNPYFKTLLTNFIKNNYEEKNIVPVGICKGAYHESEALSAKETEANILWAVCYCTSMEYPFEIDTNDHMLLKKITYFLVGVTSYKELGKLKIYVGLLYNIKTWLARILKNAGCRTYIYFAVTKENGTTKISDSKKQREKFAIRRLVERPLYLFYPLKSLMDRILRRKNYF